MKLIQLFIKRTSDFYFLGSGRIFQLAGDVSVSLNIDKWRNKLAGSSFDSGSRAPYTGMDLMYERCGDMGFDKSSGKLSASWKEIIDCLSSLFHSLLQRDNHREVKDYPWRF
jgi:hypothetical protein